MIFDRDGSRTICAGGRGYTFAKTVFGRGVRRPFARNETLWKQRKTTKFETDPVTVSFANVCSARARFPRWTRNDGRFPNATGLEQREKTKLRPLKPKWLIASRPARL